LIVSGALWFIAAMKGALLLLPLLPPKYPVGDLYDLPNFAMLVLLMLPWGALCISVYWKIEGAWLDYLDPEGARIEGSKTK